MDNTTSTLQMRTEFPAKARAGMPILLGLILVIILSIVLFSFGVAWLEAETIPTGLGVAIVILAAVVGFVAAPLAMGGLKVIRPNEARVLTLFGKYVGTLKGEGFYYVHPFCTSVAPPPPSSMTGAFASGEPTLSVSAKDQALQFSTGMRKSVISLKTMTLSNDKQKINDLLGNPIIIGIAVVWRITNTAQAVFNVDNYFEYLSIQCDSALRNTVRLYPYDSTDDEAVNEKSLRGSSQEIAARLRDEIQKKVDIAGIEIIEARITTLSYSPEIASAMLQRQQAAAVVDARQLIVDGAVGMVEMALNHLSEQSIVELDEERKAAMVSNLLVVLCANKDVQPVVNSGSIY